MALPPSRPPNTPGLPYTQAVQGSQQALGQQVLSMANVLRASGGVTLDSLRMMRETLAESNRKVSGELRVMGELKREIKASQQLANAPAQGSFASGMQSVGQSVLGNAKGLLTQGASAALAGHGIGGLYSGYNDAKQNTLFSDQMSRQVGEYNRSLEQMYKGSMQAANAVGILERQMLQMGAVYSQAAGRVSDLTTRIQQQQSLGYAFGVDGSVTNQFASTLARNGRAQGQNQASIGQTLANTYVAGGMQGRAAEMMQDLAGLNQQQSAMLGRGADLQTTSGLYTMLNQYGTATDNGQFRGNNAARLASQLSSGISNPGGPGGDMMTYMALSDGAKKPLTYGEYLMKKEEGATPESFGKVMASADKLYGDDEMGLMQLKTQLNLPSLHVAKELRAAYKQFGGGLGNDKVAGFMKEAGVGNVDFSTYGIMGQLANGDLDGARGAAKQVGLDLKGNSGIELAQDLARQSAAKGGPLLGEHEQQQVNRNALDNANELAALPFLKIADEMNKLDTALTNAGGAAGKFAEALTASTLLDLLAGRGGGLPGLPGGGGLLSGAGRAAGTAGGWLARGAGAVGGVITAPATLTLAAVAAMTAGVAAYVTEDSRMWHNSEYMQNEKYINDYFAQHPDADYMNFQGRTVPNPRRQYIGGQSTNGKKSVLQPSNTMSGGTATMPLYGINTGSTVKADAPTAVDLGKVAPPYEGGGGGGKVLKMPTPVDRNKVASPYDGGGGGGKGMYGRPTITAAGIDKVLKDAGSPAAGMGKQFYDQGVQQGIDPAYLLAFFKEESQYGTARDAKGNLGSSTANKNIGNIEYSGKPGEQRGTGGRFAAYENWGDSAKAWYGLMNSDTYRGKSTSEVVGIYAPSGDGANKPNLYSQHVEDNVARWQRMYPSGSQSQTGPVATQGGAYSPVAGMTWDHLLNGKTSDGRSMVSTSYGDSQWGGSSGSVHYGTDFRVADATLIQPVDGVVVGVRQTTTSGNVLEIEDEHGSTHVFCHLKTINVKKGQRVRGGQVVGVTGGDPKDKTSSGTMSSGKHLHYTVMRKGTRGQNWSAQNTLNPAAYLKENYGLGGAAPMGGGGASMPTSGSSVPQGQPRTAMGNGTTIPQEWRTGSGEAGPATSGGNSTASSRPSGPVRVTGTLRILKDGTAMIDGYMGVSGEGTHGYLCQLIHQPTLWYAASACP